MRGRNAQVTVFIIVGIIIVAGVLIFLLMRQGIIPQLGGGKVEENPEAFMRSCVEDKVQEAIGKISMQGGYIENKLNRTFKFEDEKATSDISYLCYNQNYYYACINQEPMLIQHLKDEIHDYVERDVEACFDDLTINLEKKANVVDAIYNVL